MNPIYRALERTHIYRLWQLPFVGQKVAPLRRRGELDATGRVLDVGCGPGTNTSLFHGSSYLGVDINPAYIAYAREQTGRDFEVADLRAYETDSKFEFIFANSFFHHVDDASTRRILERLEAALTPEGHVHIVDLVLPPERGIPRLLAKMDRGDHPRGVSQWRALFESAFELVHFEEFAVRALGVHLWEYVYFKGRRRK